MLDREFARLLARYKTWADRLTFEAVAALPAGEAERGRPTLFKSIVGTLNHSYVVDLIWQAHLEGRPHGFTARNVVPHPELEALWPAQQQVARGIRYQRTLGRGCQLAEQRRDQLAHRRMDAHAVLHHGIGEPGVHGIDQGVHHFVAPHAEDGGA